MDIIREDPVLVVKLDRGEEVMTSLARLVTDHSLSGASFSGGLTFFVIRSDIG